MYLNLTDAKIYYQKAGSGPDLVLLHGWKNDVSSWWGVVDLLKSNFTLWLIDLPGFGKSDMKKDEFDNSDFARVMAEFIKELKLNKPAVLGHSVGGRVAIKLCADFPDSAGSLILEDSAGIVPKRGIVKTTIYILAKVFKVLTPHVFGLNRKLKEAVYTSLKSDYLDAGEMKQTLVNLLGEDLSGELGKIKQDTLILWGEDDRISTTTLAMGRQMYKKIPNAKFEIIPGAGHFPHKEQPEIFAYWVKNFLE